MLFNSIEFIIFLPVVFTLYWLTPVKRNKLKNVIILFSSYVFYGWWDSRFLLLILVSTCIDFAVARVLLITSNLFYRKLLLAFSLLSNLGLLIYFKYSNFFLESFVNAFTFLGGTIEIDRLDIVLPIGISFYTFQTLSYTIDVYRNEIRETRDFISFAAYVSFFPQLVAGPIERAKDLLPQFFKPQRFSKKEGVLGLQQILWGLFKKVVIADSCAYYVNIIFNQPEVHSGSALVLGAFLFAFQIYGDFSGYSDIAIGVARLFGYRLSKNFSFPYFSRDIAEFWRRWHISLSTWFRDYVYIPLGGSRHGKLIGLRNTFIIFLVSGFWHGANWTYVVWGALNALYFIPYLLFDKNRKNIDFTAHNSIKSIVLELINIMFTFSITCVAWVFFRATSLTHAFLYLQGLGRNLFYFPFIIEEGSQNEIFPIKMLLLLFAFILFEWIKRHRDFALENFGNNLSIWTRWLVYYLLLGLVVWHWGKPQEFIYFQF